MCRLREQDLSAMRRAHDAGGVMDIQPHLACCRYGWLARMQPKADPHRDAIWPGMSAERPLHGHGGCHGIAGTGKDHEEGIALCIDLMAMMLREGAAHQVATISQHASVALAHLLQQARRAFHIAEEQRERSRRELGHRGAPRLAFWMRRLESTSLRFKGVLPWDTLLWMLSHYISSYMDEAKRLSPQPCSLMPECSIMLSSCLMSRSLRWDWKRKAKKFSQVLRNLP